MGVARSVCETLMRHLNFGNVLVWSESLDLINDIVGGVYYKGCRDIMKLLFDKFDHLHCQIPEDHAVALLKGQKVRHPNSPFMSISVQVCLVLQLLAYILDRNSSLLPAYFAHDAVCVSHYVYVCDEGLIVAFLQIRRHYPEKGGNSPHWVSPGNYCVVFPAIHFLPAPFRSFKRS